MQARANDLRGIVNGIDYDEYNPEEVVICSIDNCYIGYFDEAAKEKCRFSKEELEKYERRFK